MSRAPRYTSAQAKSLNIISGGDKKISRQIGKELEKMPKNDFTAVGLITVPVKPLSVNEVWQGKRFKTQAYKHYEKLLLSILPKIVVPEPPYEIYFKFGFSNIASDFDNPVKPLTDILQKRYCFNDKSICRAVIEKVKVEKGNEFFCFEIKHFSQ